VPNSDFSAVADHAVGGHHLFIIQYSAFACGSRRDHGSTSMNVKLPRRKFLHLAAGAAALSTVTRFAGAQAYPTRPVHLIVGTPAGLAPDIIARLVGQWLSERLGQQFVVDNRWGAGTNIATEAVVRASPDGHTLLLSNLANAVNATLYPKLGFNFIRDTVPVCLIGSGAFVMVINPSVPAKTVPEFIAYAKANSGKINMASNGIGTTPHIFGELFKMKTGVDMVHVPYRTHPVFDLISGQVQVAFLSVASSGYIKSGELRGLAVTSAERSAVLPDLPAMREFLPGYEASSWYGLSAPRNTPTAIVERLNKEINTGLADPGLAARLAELGVTPLPGLPADYGRLISEETERWAKVVNFAGIKPL
jgi:tripartite-type tricarboxylate transporter receptor subunit TctC